MSTQEKKNIKAKPQKRRPRPQNRKRVNQKKNDVPYILNTPVSAAADNTYNMSVITTMDPAAIKTMLFGLASYVLQLGLGDGSNRSTDMDFQTLWSGIDYMRKGIWEEARGGAILLSDRPRIIHDVIHALKNKTISVRGGKFSYSWNEDAVIQPIQDTVYGPVTYWCVNSGGDVPSYNSTNLAGYNGTESLENYNKLIKYLSGKKNPALAIVKCDDKSPLYNDVCTRARVYTYNGLKPTRASGWAVSVENEVPLLRPSLSKFVAYDAEFEDRRIPTQLSVESGDPCTFLGINVLGLAGNLKNSYKNRCSPRFIPLDFESIYDALCLWMVKAKKAVLSSPNNNYDIAAVSFPFTQQDFRIALMQALKGLYETSWTTQFVGPLEYNQDGNVFVPSTCGGNNFGNPEFARRMMVPELIAENLNALKARSVMAKRKDGTVGHSAIYIPILGRWWLDTPSSYQITVGEGTVPLFATTPQETINILDGTMGNTPVDCNNAFYKGVIQEWNSHVEAVKVITTSISPLVRDRGPVGLPLVLTTTLERVTPSNDATDYPTKYQKLTMDKQIQNIMPIKDTNIKTKKVTYIPAATTPQLDLQCTYTLLPQTDAELMQLIDTLITPSIRFNENLQGDVLNSQMYSVHTRFLNSITNGNFYDVDTQSKLAKLDSLANLCITGVGKESADFYDRLMKVLVDEGKASGLLSILSGIVGAIIPPLAPIAAVVGSLDK